MNEITAQDTTVPKEQKPQRSFASADFYLALIFVTIVIIASMTNALSSCTSLFLLGVVSTIMLVAIATLATARTILDRSKGLPRFKLR